MMLKPILFFTLLLVASAPAASAPALSVAVEAPAGAGPLRLQLPAQVLAASRSADYADIRLLDSSGRALSMARIDVEAAEQRQTHALTPMPVLGLPGLVDISRLAIVVDPATGRHIARVDGSVEQAKASVTLALLFDTRALRQPAAELRLEGETPLNQPIRFIVESSADLKDWTPVAEHIQYRATAGAALDAIDLGGAELRGRYLRLRWLADTALVSPVSISGADITTAATAPAPQETVRLTAGGIGSGRSLSFTLPTAAPVAAILVQPREAGLLVPVVVSGRQNADSPWVRLGAGTALRLGGAQPAFGSPIPLGSGPTAQIRIEADERTAGFPSEPAIELKLVPVALAFVGSGAQPYRLTVGEADATPAWLPLSALTPAFAGANPADLPAARIQPAAAEISAGPIESGPGARVYWLWAILVLGTVLMLLMAWRLMKRA